MDNIPNWLSAVAAVLSALIALIALYNSFKTKQDVVRVLPDFVIVSSEGKILKNSGSDISIIISLNTESIEDCHYPVPVYSMSFSKVPEYFEITTMEGATVDLKQIDTKKYKVVFVASGYGNPVVKCNFKVQIF